MSLTGNGERCKKNGKRIKKNRSELFENQFPIIKNSVIKFCFFKASLVSSL